MFELVVIYTYPRERVVFKYDSEEEAREAEQGMKIALGNQIEWSCVRPVL